MASTLFSVVGKNVLVTGGSRGIGFMIAKGFADAGANVVLTSRDEKACTDAAKQLQCQSISSNVSSREGCEALAEYVGKIFQNRLDVLVNNAGTSWGEPLEENSKSNWGFDKVLDLNVKGMFYLTRACLPLLENAATPDNPSRIINVGSVAGMVPQAFPTHAYDVSKAAVHQLTRKLAGDFSSKYITVNCLAPGFILTKMSAGLSKWTPEDEDGGTAEDLLTGAIPLQRLGNHDDMAGACIYLSSRAGSWVTGVILTVDGGSVGCRQISGSNL